MAKRYITIDNFILSKINTEFFCLSIEDIKYIKNTYKVNSDDLYYKIAKIIKSYSLPFPYMSEWMENPYVLFSNLVRYKCSYEEVDEYRADPLKKFLSGTIDSKFRGKYILFVSDDKYYKSINMLTYYFQEKVIIKCKRASYPFSPFKLWDDINLLKKVIQKNIENKENLTLYNLREVIHTYPYECGLFKLTIAKTVIKFFEATKILDISSGWGDRLIAAISLEDDIKYYHGYDPNSDLFPGYNEIINKFSSDRNKFRMVNEPFQDVVLDSKYDLIFTSPPFFILEDYGYIKRKNEKYGTTNTNQSIDSFPDFLDWVVKFLFISLHKAWDKLEVGKYMVINIEDAVIKENNKNVFYLYSEPMILFVNGYLKNANFLGTISHIKDIRDIKKTRPLYVWVKDKNTNSEKAEFNKKNLKEFYNEIYNLTESIFVDNMVNLSYRINDRKNDYIEIDLKEIPQVNELPLINISNRINKSNSTSLIINELSENYLNKYNDDIDERINKFKYILQEHKKFRKERFERMLAEEKLREKEKLKEEENLNSNSDIINLSSKSTTRDTEEIFKPTLSQIKTFTKDELLAEIYNQRIKLNKSSKKEIIAYTLFNYFQENSITYVLPPLAKIMNRNKNNIEISLEKLNNNIKSLDINKEEKEDIEDYKEEVEDYKEEVEDYKEEVEDYKEEVEDYKEEEKEVEDYKEEEKEVEDYKEEVEEVEEIENSNTVPIKLKSIKEILGF